MPARFRMSKRGVGELLRSEPVRAEMLRRARLIAATAESIAPVGGPYDPHRGSYKGSFKTMSTSRGGIRGDRATASVYNDAPWARFVEYGTERGGPAHHVLLRAALAVGGGS